MISVKAMVNDDLIMITLKPMRVKTRELRKIIQVCCLTLNELVNELSGISLFKIP